MTINQTLGQKLKRMMRIIAKRLSQSTNQTLSLKQWPEGIMALVQRQRVRGEKERESISNRVMVTILSDPNSATPLRTFTGRAKYGGLGSSVHLGGDVECSSTN
jgi:hypothetical protein